MSSQRTLSWSAALRDTQAGRAARSPVREERMHVSAGLHSNPPVALSAWRGHSGRRYVVRVEALSLDTLETAQDAVCIAVGRDDLGRARPVDTTTGLTRSEAVEWLCSVHRAGASELHVHRLAQTSAGRAAIVADLL